jgi:DNA polymerase I
VRRRTMTPVTCAEELRAAGFLPGSPLAVAVAPGVGVAVAWQGGHLAVPVGQLAEVGVLSAVAQAQPRWTWWSARESAPWLIAAGLRPRACWDVGAVGRLLHGLRRDDPAAVWAAQRGLAEPPVVRGELDLLDLAGEDGSAVRGDGQLSRDWLRGRWARDLAAAQQWASLALSVQQAQVAALAALQDPRAVTGTAGSPPLAVLNAYAESAAAVLAVELEHDGLPLASGVLESMLGDLVGARPSDETEQEASRAARDRRVLELFPGEPVDLRNPLAVRALLVRVGIDVPDTRSWRLEPYAASSPAVAALLAWRKAERVATTYGYGWLDRSVAGGRLRGAWAAADGGAGRMTAQAGLHNLPTELRAAVRAEPGMVFVRGDLGQVEPRVLAAVSGDGALARAASEQDMYAPVAARLDCDRPTAKVAVLAAMYGQTSGPAGQALKQMDHAYPTAMAYLRTAEAAGLDGRDQRTYGGRLLPGLGGPGSPGHGRYVRNAVIQGAAAELFKAWAATVRSALAALDGQIVLCLHDELLLHVPADRAAAAGDLLVSALASTAAWWAAGSGVRFVVEVAVGATWADAH